MQPAPYDQLKALGYLSSPVARATWRIWSPQQRNSLRLLFLVWLLWASAISGLIGGCALAPTSVQWRIGFFYWGLAAPTLVLLTWVQSLLFKIPGLRQKLAQGNGLNYWDIAWAVLILVAIGLWLADSLHQKPLSSQLWLWSSLAVLAYVGGQWLKVLAIQRLYWYGLHPPPLKHHPWLMGVGLLLILLGLGYHSVTQQTRQETTGSVLVLAFDGDLEHIQTRPDWDEMKLHSQQDEISAAWVSLGTGVAFDQHRASLFGFSVGPLSPLTWQDRIQRPIIWVGQSLGLAQLNPEGGRFRPYVWEIMDQAGYTTASMGYWHTFPATALHGLRISERWQIQSDFPYSTGLPPLSHEPDALDLAVSPAVQPVLERERHQWAYLHQIWQNPPDFGIAYFPLEDILIQQGEPASTLERLRLYRKTQLEKLFLHLPQETSVFLVYSSGRLQGQGVDWIIQTQAGAWFPKISDIRQVAPVLLQHFGLALDRDMLDPPSLNEKLKRVEYRRNPALLNRSNSEDQAYLEQLRSLGYIH